MVGSLTTHGVEIFSICECLLTGITCGSFLTLFGSVMKRITAGRSFADKCLLGCSRCSTSLLSVSLTPVHKISLKRHPAVTQNVILFLLSLPTKIAVTQPHTSLGLTDYALGALGFIILLFEFIADNQQYSFQTFKRSGKLNPNEWFGARIAWTKRDAERGFVTRGLWAWSRHPNFFCEQTFWVCWLLG